MYSQIYIPLRNSYCKHNNMDPCPFLRIVIGNLGLRFPKKPNYQLEFYCKFKLKGFTFQVSDISFLDSENDVVESKIHGCFNFSKLGLEKLYEKSGKLKIEVYRRVSYNGCGFLRSDKVLGCFVVNLDLKGLFENGKVSVIQNGWVSIVGGSGLKLHLNVRAEPDPRFVFRFDGEPECSPQVFQVNGNVKQPVFTCKFGLRNSGERNLRSRSSSSEPSTPNSCFSSNSSKDEHPLEERKGWSIIIHDLSGSPVAAASMVTPFVPSNGSDRVGKSNPGAWLILRHGQATWRPWGRLEAWREHKGDDRLGFRFELIPDGGIDSITIPLVNSSVSMKKGGKFNIEISNGITPMASPYSSFDLSSGGSGSDIGSTSGSGSWVQLLYRGFVMSSTLEGDGRRSKPEVEVGVQHVSCTEDAAAYVALAAAMDLSMDACRLFSQKLRKELRQVDLC